MKKKGFTLIELLVVISIIALLLSILMPALTKVKEQAKFVVCGSNIRQMVTAEVMYTTENDGKFSDAMECLSLPYSDGNPTIADRSDTANAWDKWHDEKYNNDNRHDLWGLIWPYLENQKVALCPTFKSLSLADGANHPNCNLPGPIEPQYSYSKNVWLGDPSKYWDWAADYEARNVSNVNRPSEVFMFAEENMWTIGSGSGRDTVKGVTGCQWSEATLNDNGLFTIWDGAPGVNDAFGTFHKTTWTTNEKMNEGVSNVAFADGHIGIALNYADGPDYKNYITEPRNCVKLSDPKGWYRTIYPTGP